jgi:3-dehydroquinate synthase
MDAPSVEVWAMAAGEGNVYLGPAALATFCATIAQRDHRVFVLTDQNTHQDCLPILSKYLTIDAQVCIPAGESHKNLESLAQVWEAFSQAHLTRGDLLINLGGGVVCDLGGFAASTYKRGIRFVHMPTTVLAMADAAIGGKTGIDFMGYKNQIGSFQQPMAVVVHTAFLETLPARELRSGYAEVLKHLLISDAAGWMAATDAVPEDWDAIVAKAIGIKLHFTESDPHEKGMRKALNFGHTVGHALESYFLTHDHVAPILHGEAVAAGMVCEAWLCCQRGLLTADAYTQIQNRLMGIFPKLTFPKSDIAAIARWCLQDKKNNAGQIKAALLDGIGGYRLDITLTLPDIEASLLHYFATPF